jgi:hypothetical protein
MAAGAMVGLGLACIGEGMRYQTNAFHSGEGNQIAWVRFYDMDTALLATFIGLAIMAIIGLIITFIGLSYEHHHRHHELLHLQGRTAEGTHRVGV